MSNCEKYFVKLPKGSPSHLTSFQTFLGTSISSKTPGKDFKDIERERFKIFYLYGVFEDMGVPDTAWGDVRGLTEPLGSFTKIFFTIRHQDPL